MADELRKPDSVFNHLRNGLTRAWFDKGNHTLAEYRYLKPNYIDTVDSFVLSNSQFNDNVPFVVVFRAYLAVYFGSFYTFYIRGGDSCALFIGDTIILGGKISASCAIGLAEGFHALTLVYAGCSNNTSLSIEYSCEELGRVKLASYSLFVEALDLPLSIEVLRPAKTDTLGKSDTLSIQWVYRGGIGRMVTILLSVDGGKTFSYNLSPQKNIVHKTEEMTMLIPVDSILGDTICNSLNAVVRIYDYANSEIDDLSEQFNIICKSGYAFYHKQVKSKKTSRLSKTVFIGERQFRLQANAFDLCGRVICKNANADSPSLMAHIISALSGRQ